MCLIEKLYFCTAEKFKNLKFFIISYLLLLLNLSVFCQDNHTVWVSSSNKHIGINTMVKDFGVVNQNDRTVFKFELINLDTSRLVIWHVTTSCG